MSDTRDGSSRQQIKDIALELFSTQGFSGTSLREIAERMNFTKAALYYHYPSKGALLEDLLAPMFVANEELAAGLTQPLDSAEKVREYLGEYLDIVISNRHIAQILVGDPAVFVHPQVGPRIQQVLEHQMTVLSGEGTAEARIRALAILRAAGAALDVLDVDADELHATLLASLMAIYESRPEG